MMEPTISSASWYSISEDIDEKNLFGFGDDEPRRDGY